MKVSILVPVYNKAEYLRECIDSLVNQTFTDIEIVLVDDESTDESGAICDEYAEKDPRIKVIHQKNAGTTGAWRSGFAAAKGRYILFVDADDWVDTDMVERMVALTSGRDDEIISSDYIIEKSDGTQTKVFQILKPGRYKRKEMIETVIPMLWGQEDRLIHTSRCMKLISTRLIRENEHYSRGGLRFGEDIALTFPSLLDCGRLVVMDHKAMYHYRYVTDSMVHCYDKTLMDSITLLFKLTGEMINDKFTEENAAEYPDGYADKLRSAMWKEWPFLLAFAVKNEVRGNKDGYIDAIREICLEPENRKLIRNPDISVSQKANKLVFYVMKHPTAMNCRILKLAMRIKDNA